MASNWQAFTQLPKPKHPRGQDFSLPHKRAVKSTLRVGEIACSGGRHAPAGNARLEISVYNGFRLALRAGPVKTTEKSKAPTASDFSQTVKEGAAKAFRRLTSSVCRACVRRTAATFPSKGKAYGSAVFPATAWAGPSPSRGRCRAATYEVDRLRKSFIVF